MQSDKLIFTLFDKIPVKQRKVYGGDECSESYIKQILLDTYNVDSFDEIGDEIKNIYINNKSGLEIVIYVLSTHEIEKKVTTTRDGAVVVIEFITTVNIVKKTAKELGMTQKQLAEYIGVNENTIGNWARGKIEVPQMALKLLELLVLEKKYNTAKQLFCDLENK